MRQPGLGDLHHAACALHSVPHPARAAFCAQMLWQAHVADKYVKRLRRLHPQWGDGSLRAVALCHYGGGERARRAADLWPCMTVVIEALAARTWAGPTPRCARTGLQSAQLC